tara:strand:+ start:354 stop:473 length:120 start_codon:yes stop_codon:yes gene_type:complete
MTNLKNIKPLLLLHLLKINLLVVGVGLSIKNTKERGINC